MTIRGIRPLCEGCPYALGQAAWVFVFVEGSVLGATLGVLIAKGREYYVRYDYKPTAKA